MVAFLLALTNMAIANASAILRRAAAGGDAGGGGLVFRDPVGGGADGDLHRLRRRSC